MSFTGHGWRSGQSGDITGTASTATVSSISPNTGAASGGLITVTVTGTGYVNGDVIYANYAPLATTFLSATQLRTTVFNSRPDSGSTIPVGVKKSGQALSNTVNFTAT
jgi:hypothetical protein